MRPASFLLIKNNGYHKKIITQNPHLIIDITGW